jgi:sugar phosphate isomerase/epimerase
MARPIILFSGQWTDLPFEQFVAKVSDWGYQGVELCCWGDHFEVQRAVSEEEYCQAKLDFLTRYELTAGVLATHRVGQAICDPIDIRHKDLLPDYVWGDGTPDEVSQRAVEEMLASVRAAQKMGVAVVSSFSGSSLWSYVMGYPAASSETITRGLSEFAERWNPILDACGQCGVKLALEVHPGQMAFDLTSAEMTLEAVGNREELGFTLDPSHLHWQGLDPVEFIRRFPERIFHVHIKDAMLTLNGRRGLLNGYLPYGDPRRGWDFRAPGRGGIDWEAFIRALNEIGYEGGLAVEWKDAGMNREFGAEEACRFVKRLDFEPARRNTDGQIFRES